MNLSRIGLLFFALLSLSLSGCGGGFRPGGVAVAALSLQVGSSSAIGVRAPLVLRFTNENVIPLGYSSSSHKLYLEGTYVGKALNDQPIGLPPLTEASREIYVQFENPSFIRQLATGKANQLVAYRMETVLFQTAGDDKLEIKIHSEGNLELRTSDR